MSSSMVMDEDMVTLFLSVALKNCCFLSFWSLRGGLFPLVPVVE